MDILPNSEKADESGRLPWSQNGLVSARATSARSQESEREYEDFVRSAESLVQRLRQAELNDAIARRASEGGPAH